ncbi:MAG: hypothetical protein OXG47_09795 [bacterium]|nr:hypothetical protein [bacterium]
MATTVVCWNIAMRHKAWRRLAEMDADVALLQEAGKPADALSQFDYVFASRGFHNEVTARALNTVEEWGPSDHCRLLIEVAG